MSVSFRRSILRLPVIGPTIVFIQRLGYATKIDLSFKGQVLRWLFKSREKTNLTYSLSEANINYLAAAVAEVTGITVGKAREYIDELDADKELAAHISSVTDSHPRKYSCDLEPRYGRRAGWYAVIRAIKPSVIVETGVDKGLGSVVLCAALLKNREEGRAGQHYGTDIDPGAGFLLTGRYAEVGKVLYNDSIESLKKIDGPIDVFVNDSDHSSEYEGREYETIRETLAEDAVIIGDNAHVTDKLFKFAEDTGRKFLYFGEIPADHWYPGGGIGFAYRSRV